MLASLVQPVNTHFPIVETLEGMVMPTMLLFPKNAITPIEVTPSGMVTFGALPLYLTRTVPFISKSWLKSESGAHSAIHASAAVMIVFLLIFSFIAIQYTPLSLWQGRLRIFQVPVPSSSFLC